MGRRYESTPLFSFTHKLVWIIIHLLSSLYKEDLYIHNVEIVMLHLLLLSIDTINTRIGTFYRITIPYLRKIYCLYIPVIGYPQAFN